MKSMRGRNVECADAQIDFNDLPDLALHRYLELHDLLPRWDVSPWSEKPCTPRTRRFVECARRGWANM